MEAQNLEDAVNDMLKDIAQNLVKDLSEKMIECLKDHIWNDVYIKDHGDPTNKIYVGGDGSDGSYGLPTFEFMNAFRFDDITKGINDISTNLVYDYLGMHKYNVSYVDEYGENKTYGVHQTVEGEDLREQLFDLLNTDEIFGGKERDKYWDNFINDIETNLDTWITQSLNKQGIR